MDDPVWDSSTFSKNRERLLASDIAGAFFQSVRSQAEAAKLLTDDHFTVDGTLIEAWASIKSFRPQGTDTQNPPATGSGRWARRGGS